MENVTIKNEYHNSAARIRVRTDGETILSRATVRRVRRALCGISGCDCGGVLGERGWQAVAIDAMPDGTVMVGKGRVSK